MDTTEIVIVTATFFLAGIVKGVTGMGLPTVAMGVLGALISPLSAAALLLVPSFVTNLWQLLAGPDFRAVLRRFWPMMAMLVIGTVLGAGLLAGGDTARSTMVLGLTLAAYAVYSLCAGARHVPPSWQPVASPLVGLASGIVTGATGVFVIPAVPYLQSLGLGKDALVQALGLSFTVSTIALGLALGLHGALPAESLLPSLLAVAPALAGMGTGQAIRRHIHPATFRRCFLACLLLLGCEMALRPFL
ncbi:sulfite exporter TauE/SafE family protein [Shinella sp. S4-D37]|uniref:sulfite exporter TauE/SafE family protein n=1 Tax=Shinella sp. S4-D37 TaxID=3161999 RepID=UPI0034676F31